MPLNITTGGMSAKGFGFTNIPAFSLVFTFSVNTTSYNIATAATAAGWNGVTALNVNLTIPSGVSINGTGNTTNSAIIIPSSVPEKSVIRINNSGTVYGSGGAGGYTGIAGIYQENGNTDGVGYGGDVPNNPYGDSGGYPPINGSSGSAGGTAIYMATNCKLDIYNYGTIVGGGGGAGGNGGNNAGGGSGGNGGFALVETGTPLVTLYNQAGGTFAGGGGGGSGWGNRIPGSTEGGSPGNPGVITNNGGGNFGAQGSAGQVSTNNATTIYSGAGTHSL